MSAFARHRWLVLLLVAIAARAAAFGNPLVHADEEFYLIVARAMLHGALPYVEVWDRKPLGLFLLFMPAATLPLPWAVLAGQALALACVVATAALVGRFAERAGWARGATAAGIAYILWLDLLGGVGGQSPVFYDLPMATAAWLTLTASRRRTGVAAMALAGLALQIKYAVVAEGMFFALWLLAAQWRRGCTPVALAGYAAALALATLLPTVAAFGFYAVRGEAQAWAFANLLSVLRRHADPAGDQLRNAAVLALILGPLLAMAAARGAARAGDRTARRFLSAWTIVAVASVVAFGGWYDHYGLPVALPAAACAAGFLAGRHRRAAPALLLAVAVAGQAKVWIRRAQHGDGAQLAAVAAAVGHGPGALWVYSGETLLYPLSGRAAPTRYLFPSHLYLARERGAIGVDQAGEVRRILADRPAVIVMRPPQSDEEPPIRALVSAAVARGYRAAAVLPVGREQVTVYRRR